MNCRGSLEYGQCGGCHIPQVPAEESHVPKLGSFVVVAPLTAFMSYPTLPPLRLPLLQPGVSLIEGEPKGGGTGSMEGWATREEWF